MTKARVAKIIGKIKGPKHAQDEIRETSELARTVSAASGPVKPDGRARHFRLERKGIEWLTEQAWSSATSRNQANGKEMDIAPEAQGKGPRKSFHREITVPEMFMTFPDDETAAERLEAVIWGEVAKPRRRPMYGCTDKVKRGGTSSRLPIAAATTAAFSA